MRFTKLVLTDFEVKYLRADCGVRYWEDATVNGVEDIEGTLIPHRNGDAWVILIDVDTGQIQDWPTGTVAKTHYKVCDAGIYQLLDKDFQVIATIDGYVPSMMSPGGSGYGDYVIMNIDENGLIDKWHPNFDPFEVPDE